MFKLAEYAKQISELERCSVEAMKTAGYNYTDTKQDAQISIVVAGQYSAGKSTIIKMLTGRNDIEIGAKITTQKADIYEWNGLRIVDTPGIHTELRPDHDEISYSEIASADMLIYVITNELFDNYLAEHFRKLAIDKNKAGEMILVVNKMERTAYGNTEIQQSILREDLRKVLDPYTPEQMNLCFLDAQSYIDGLEEREDDPEEADELIETSGYEDFIKTLNHFVSTKGTIAKETTRLYMLDEQLGKAIKSLEPHSSDKNIDALELNFQEQRHTFSDARNRLKQEIMDIYVSAATEIRTIGLDAANIITEGCNKDEVERELEDKVRKAEKIIDSCQEKSVEVFENRLEEVGEALDSIENSEVTKNMKASLEGNFDVLPENIKKILTGASGGAHKAGQFVLQNAYKSGVNGGLKLSNFSGSTIHDLVKKAGHSIGYKFKPWEAIKLTKGIAIGSQILGALGVGASIFMQIKADQDEDKRAEELRKNRQNIRSQFNTAANELEDHGRVFVRENISKSLDNSIQNIDNKIKEIQSTRTDRNQLCRDMEEMQSKCHTLIREIHLV